MNEYEYTNPSSVDWRRNGRLLNLNFITTSDDGATNIYLTTVHVYTQKRGKIYVVLFTKRYDQLLSFITICLQKM